MSQNRPEVQHPVTIPAPADPRPGARGATGRFLLELSFRDIYLLGQWPDPGFGNSLDPHDISSACPGCGRNRFAPGGCHGHD